MSGDEEFDTEAFAAYEDELYREKSISSNEDELDSEDEVMLYSQVHYAPLLLVSDESSSGKKIPDSVSEYAGNKDRPSKEGNRSGIPVIEISSDDDNMGKEVNLEASCSYPEVVGVFSKERTTETNNLAKESPLSPGSESLGKMGENWNLDERDLGAATLSKRRPRYYNPKKGPSYLRCYNCNERGHLSEYCPEPKKVGVCSLCGLAGHFRRFCPNELCFNCREPGHQSKECRQARVRPFDRCRRCFMPAHLAKNCPDLWRRYHITTQVGPVVCPSRCPSPTEDVFCYNCGQLGHYGHECTEERPYEWRQNGAILPFIVSYDAFTNPSSGRRGNAKYKNRYSRAGTVNHDGQSAASSCDYQRQDHSAVTGFAQPPPQKKPKRSQEKRMRNASFDDESHANGLRIEVSSESTNKTRKKKAKQKKKKTPLQNPEVVPARRVVEILDRSPSDDGLIEEPCEVANIRKLGKKRRRNSDRFESKRNNNHNFKRDNEKSSSKSLRARDNGSFRSEEFNTGRRFFNPRRGGRGFVSNRGFRFHSGKSHSFQ